MAAGYLRVCHHVHSCTPHVTAPHGSHEALSKAGAAVRWSKRSFTGVQARSTSTSSSVSVNDVDRRLLLHGVLLSIDTGPATLCRRLHASTPLLPLLTAAVSTAVSAFSSAAEAFVAENASVALPAPPLWLQPAFAVLAHFAAVHPAEPAPKADGRGASAGNATEKATHESMEGVPVAQAAHVPMSSADDAAACAAAAVEEIGGAGGEEAQSAAASTSSAGALLHVFEFTPTMAGLSELFVGKESQQVENCHLRQSVCGRAAVCLCLSRYLLCSASCDRRQAVQLPTLS